MRKTPQFSNFRNNVLRKPRDFAQTVLIKDKKNHKKHEKDQNNQQIMRLSKDDFVLGSDSKISADFQSSLKLGQQLASQSILLRRKQNKQPSYKKNTDLNLSDYLRLYSMSKKSQVNKKRNNSAQPKLVKNRQTTKTYQTKHAIDTVQSIKVVRQQTKKQITSTHLKLKKFLQILDTSQHIKSDQQSLVFMCNVLHIFEQRILKSVKYAQQLINDRKRQKTKQEFKQYSKCSSPIIRRASKIRQKSESKSPVKTKSQFNLTIQPVFSHSKNLQN